jgi:hypothetical protein
MGQNLNQDQYVDDDDDGSTYTFVVSSILILILGLLCFTTFVLGDLNKHVLIVVTSVAALYILLSLIALVRIYRLPKGARDLLFKKFLYRIGLGITISVLALSASVLALVLESPPVELEYAFLVIGVCLLLVFFYSVPIT